MNPAPAAASHWELPETKLPLDPFSLTYRVKFDDQPDVVGWFILAGAPTQDFSRPADLLLYEKGKFLAARSVAISDLPKGKRAGMIILRFQSDLPVTLAERKPRLSMEWIIENATLESFHGVQQTIGLPPGRFTAERVQAATP